MPANQGKNGPTWNPRPDFQHHYDITAASAMPRGSDELRSWLDDTGVLPDAEAYRHVNPAVFRSIIDEAAERILVDMRGEFYTVSEATEMHLQRQTHGHLGVYAVRITEAGRDVMPTTVDQAA